MKKSLMLSSVAVFLLVAGTGVVQAQKKTGSAHAKKVVYASADKAKYKEMPGGQKASMAIVWGDPDKGAHGTFTKFEPGFEAPDHTHTSDITIVVIKGAYLYKDEAGEKRVGPGEFLRIPGGHKHWSGGDKKEGALFYEEGPGKFDEVSAK